MQHRKYSRLLLVLPPLILVLSALYLQSVRGPCWLGANLDPEYAYLLNSANLALGAPVGYTDHPGTPLQVLGAVTLRCAHAIRAAQGADLQTAVLEQPEYHLAAMLAVLTALNALVLLCLGAFVLRCTGSIRWSLFLQMTPFFCPVFLQFGLCRIMPEPLLVFCALIVVSVLVCLAVTSPVSTKKQRLPAAFLGIATGLGIAAKVTFLPLLVIPLIALRGVKNKIGSFAVALGSFVFFTLPILPRYARFFDWLFQLGSRSGQYGSGPVGFVPLETYSTSIARLLAADIFFSAVLLAAGVFIAAVCLIPPWRSALAKTGEFKTLLAAAAAQVLGVLLVAKHFSPHYLLPELCLSGLMAYLLFSCLKNLLARGCLELRQKTFSAGFLLFMAACMGAANPAGEFLNYAEIKTKSREKSLHLLHLLQTDYADYAKIYYYRASSPEYALKFGNSYALGLHTPVLEKLYPGGNFYFYDRWKQTFSTFDGWHTLLLEDIRAQHGDKIVFLGGGQVTVPGVTLKSVSPAGHYEELSIIDRNRHIKKSEGGT